MLAEAKTFYEQSDIHSLKPSNTHVDFRDEWVALHRYRHEQIEDRWYERLYANILTAVGEDILRYGTIDFQVFTNQNGNPIITTPDHQMDGDITTTTLNGAKKKRGEGKNWAREYYEVLGMRALKKQLLNGYHQDKFVLIYPPGEKEDGYTGISLIYIYEISDDMESLTRNIKAHFYKSTLNLEGHRQLFNRLSTDSYIDVSESLTPEHFVSKPVIANSEHSVSTIFKTINALEYDEYLRSPGVTIGQSISTEQFNYLRPQIDEAVAFLSQVISSRFNQHQGRLTQQSLEEIELAYSFVKQSINNYGSGKAIKNRHELKRGYSNQIIANTIIRRETGPTEEELRFLASHQAYILSQYGYESTQKQQIGGAACPGGETQVLGVEGLNIPTEQINWSDPQFESQMSENREIWEWKKGDCVVPKPKCGRKNVDVGPCNVCRVCQKAFDEGKM